ncbi:MMPL family transporter [Pseudoclavibacter sp. AY1F1]|uniref:MMPL family transporter n=1 Tax=Pseudoclavibacter sp. AY1F1 TaxID=2080583 RepID=UPI000CE89DF7|nr:MMPL family transporter [Pseudoclavibacter sp. AY1F1]PPF42363.1 MMPL family transporter [Pseudoclavibacter sp. AY1F1]
MTAPGKHAAEPERASLLRRVGAWSAEHPRKTFGGWAALIILSVLFALVGVGGQNIYERLENGTPQVDGEAGQVDDLLEAAENDDSRALNLLVYGVAPDDRTLAAHLDPLPDKLQQIQDENPGSVLTISDPRQGLAALESGVALSASDAARVQALAAADGNGILVVVRAGTEQVGSEEQTPARRAAQVQALELLDGIAEELKTVHPDATVHVSSEARIATSYRAVAAADLERGEGIALPIALLVMIVVFGGILAAGVPILGAIASILLGYGSLFALSFAFGFDSIVLNVVTLLGLGLAIDYGLLVISRFREEMRDVGEGDRSGIVGATASTVEHAGRTVVFSGTIFAAASLGLLLFEPTIMRAIGVGTIAVVAIAIAVSISLVPAILATAGHKLTKPGLLARVKPLRPIFGRLGTVTPDDGNFGKLARWSQRRPALVTAACVLLLGVLASPALSLIPVNDVSGAVPRAATEYSFIETIADEFPDAAPAKVELVIRAETGASADSRVAAWAQDMAGDPRVASVGVPEQTESYATVRVHPEEGANAMDLVERAREAAPADAEAWVTGTAAHDLDLISSVQATAPWAALIICGLTFVLLFLMTGSVIMPIKSLAIALLSLGSAVGVLVWGFQDGHLAGVLNFEPDDINGVDVLVLTITLVLGFGLSMDYEVFLLGRVAELRDRGVAGREAVWKGLQGTGRIITSAALIMVVVFLGFTLGDLLIIKQMGTALAVLVALDATLVRCVLVPAAMTWGESIMWWSPRWLRPVADRLRIRH